MFVIVTVDVSMALKTDWYGIIDVVRTSPTFLLYVVKLHFDTTKPMTNTASPVALFEQFSCFLLLKSHGENQNPNRSIKLHHPTA